MAANARCTISACTRSPCRGTNSAFQPNFARGRQAAPPFRYGLALGETSGEVVGINDGVGVGDVVPEGDGDSAGVGKAKVGATSGIGEGVADSLGDGVTLGEGAGVGVGVGIKLTQ